MPTLPSVKPKRALATATEMSAQTAVMQPPARHSPLTAAMTTLGQSRMAAQGRLS